MLTFFSFIFWNLLELGIELVNSKLWSNYKKNSFRRRNIKNKNTNAITKNTNAREYK